MVIEIEFSPKSQAQSKRSRRSSRACWHSKRKKKSCRLSDTSKGARTFLLVSAAVRSRVSEIFEILQMCRKQAGNLELATKFFRKISTARLCSRSLFHFSFALTFDLCDIFNFHSLWLSLKLNHAARREREIESEANPDKSQTEWTHSPETQARDMGKCCVLIL